MTLRSEKIFSVGNIRYGTLKKGVWNFTTIYRQPLPVDYFTAVEMFGMCLLISEETETIHIIGQELVTKNENDYTCDLIHFTWGDFNNIIKLKKMVLVLAVV